MPKPIVGLHHVTAIASDAQKNIDFYTRVMGLRCVKRTINFDDPGTYHLYFADDAGSPGTTLSFFCWPRAPSRAAGTGEVLATALTVAPSSLDYWEKRLAEAGLATHRFVRFGEEGIGFEDPDCIQLELVGHAGSRNAHGAPTGSVPIEHAIRGLFGVSLCESRVAETTAILNTMGFRKVAEDGERLRFALAGSAVGNQLDLVILPEAIIPSPLGRPYVGTGSVHHIAFRAADEASQLDWRTLLIAASLDVTPVLDRIYFQSIYFREPGGVLFELATDFPGFLLDEPAETLGEHLKLPPWMERQRDRVERLLPPLQRRPSSREKKDAVDDPHRDQPTRSQGAPLAHASAVVILLHGRGASAEDILELVDSLYDERITYLAPEAAGHRWYPYSFLAPLDENEPWLSSALTKVQTTMQLALNAGIPRERIVLCGFSQGACLSAEFIARHPARYGGLIAFTGGLIGPPDLDLHRRGDLSAMPAWFSSGDPDPHVPWSRVLASAEQFTALGARVQTRRFPGRPHTVLPEEAKAASEWILGQLNL